LNASLATPSTQWATPRLSWAENPAASRGRLYPEGESRTRNPFARDRDRIIHSTAFRRLKEKTQVFVAHEGDYYRTRLTHSLEVAQIARSIARALGLDDDLAETVAIAHDLGHPPFGHAGEDALDACMKPYGGFDHNVQTFRVVSELELRYPAFPGLNLTWETLEGVIKHNGPVLQKLKEPAWAAIAAYDEKQDLLLATYASAEAQVAALADDIAYNNHDIDDGLQAEVFAISDLLDVPLIGPAIHSVRQEWPGIDARLLRLESIRRMIGAMVDDVMGETLRNAASLGLKTAEDVRHQKQATVAFSRDMLEDLGALRAFLYNRMYRHYRVNRSRSATKRKLVQLFELFMAEPDVLPPEWGAPAMAAPDENARARLVCDYIAGMTDRFAIEEHHKLFNGDSTR
jgi:dGTPase